MKKIKKIAGLLLALVMVLAMSATAFAEDGTTETKEGSITIENAVSGKSYELYRIFDLTYSGSGNNPQVAYTINNDWTAFFAEGGDGAAYIVNTNSGNLKAIIVGGVVKYINITEDNVAAFSTAAQAYAVKMENSYAVKAEGESETVSNLPLGYYLVYPVGASEITGENGSVCSLTSTVPSVTVSIKAKTPTITKTDDKDSANVGDTVTYTIKGKVPDTTGYRNYIYTITDTMSDGLTYNDGSISVEIDDAEITISDGIEITTNADGTTTLTITIPVKSYQNQVGDTITVTYSATINKNAVASVENNRATLTYSNNPDKSGTGTPEDTEDPNVTDTTTPVVAKVYTSKIVIDKVDGSDSDKKLEGATFILYKEVNEEGNTSKQYYKVDSEGNVTWGGRDEASPVTTDEDGAASFGGLADGTYYLEETVAPDGYNLLTTAQNVEVTGGEAEISLTTTAKVANNAGSLLPETGGMGTTLFYVFGGLMVLAAVVLLVTRKRMSAS